MRRSRRSCATSIGQRRLQPDQRMRLDHDANRQIRYGPASRGERT
ncbi:hypothetical protein I552_2743 [Mycobacterium xenopi 3993]|nr:hypothetical protein I552_2743 [Mycobacterium xenopi 3993]